MQKPSSDSNLAQNQKKSKKKAFDFQLEILKIEIELTNQAISRIDEITQTTKNWTVVIWSSSMALCLSRIELQNFIIFTAIIPFLFWLIDGLWRYYCEAFIFRQDKISDFLNDYRLLKSFEQKQFADFIVLDPRGQHYRKDIDYKKTVNFFKSLFLGEVWIFYLGLISISIFTGFFLIK